MTKVELEALLARGSRALKRGYGLAKIEVYLSKLGNPKPAGVSSGSIEHLLQAVTAALSSQPKPEPRPEPPKSEPKSPEPRPEPPKPEPKSPVVEAMTKKDLLALAKDRGLEVDAKITKSDLIGLLS